MKESVIAIDDNSCHIHVQVCYYRVMEQ
jgi:hypothetical protein